MIEWEKLKARLRATEQALLERPSLADEKVKRTLAMRAERLAERSRAKKSAGTEISVLMVKIAEERFALPVEQISEIVPFQVITPVPGAPSEVRGVINLRGEILTVAQTSALLELSPSGNHGKIVLLRRTGKELGLFVDKIEEMETVDLDRFNPSEGSRYSRGVNPEAISLLDCETILNHPSFWGDQ